MKRLVLPQIAEDTIQLSEVSDQYVLLVRGKGQNHTIGIVRYLDDKVTFWHVAIGQKELFKTGYVTLHNLLLNLTQSGYEVFVQ